MAAEPPVAPGRDEARRWAEEELAKPEYRDADPGWLAGVWEAIMDWLRAVDGPGADGTATAPWIGVFLVALIGAAIILVRPRLNAKVKRPTDMFDADPTVTATAYRGRAAAAAAAGDWDAAVVDSFRAVVRTAEERNVLDPRPGRTADEVARELATPFSPKARQLGDAARTFDGVRYGNESAGPTAYAAMLELDTALRSLKPERHHVPAGRDDVEVPG
ncbi:DUF4129 domain-containing protein [Pseudarthrobacter sp. DSP2-3-2b1]|uniref:DUF4129 domain-containing protein n=1 Tax=Pseudarthrobacter sp. DSP2-3-2b1 TaxID=2804661 RepID=UPI003CF39649